MDLPFDRFLNRVYYWFIKDREPNEIAKFDLQLWLPPKGADIPEESPWSAENETRAFKAFQSSIQGD